MRTRSGILFALVLALMAVTPAPSGQDQTSSEDELSSPRAEGTIGVDAATRRAAGGDQATMRVVELLSYIAVIAASLAAIVGVIAWRHEFKGKRDIELAEDVLCLFYRAERAIEAIRCPGSYASEGQTRTPEESERSEQKQARDQAHVVVKRIQDHGEILDQLYTLRFRFMARFGRDRAKPFDEMRDVVIKIRVSAMCLAVLWADRLRRGNDTKDGTEKQIEKHEAVIWSSGVKDPMESGVKRIVEEIEAICRPIIDGQGSWFSQLWTRVLARKAVSESCKQIF